MCHMFSVKLIYDRNSELPKGSAERIVSSLDHIQHVISIYHALIHVVTVVTRGRGLYLRSLVS